MPIKLKVESKDFSQGLVPLLSFPQGIPPHFTDMSIQVYQKGDDTKRKREVLTTVKSNYGSVTFKGTDYDQNSAKYDTCKYAIGVLDETTQTMHMYPAGHAFVMKPVFDENKVATNDFSDMTYSERLRASTDAFGSKKKKKSLKASDSNRISAANVMGVISLEKSLAIVTATSEEGL